MSHSENSYQLTEHRSVSDLSYLFISKGKANIIKVVQYSFVQVLGDRKIYNLGFGDYDVKTDFIDDSGSTNNGDAYKVFNTVLSTIPAFFKAYPKEILMVEGSDGREGFAEECRLTCRKKCGKICRKYNKRIRIYCGYIDKNYNDLVLEYDFSGATFDRFGQAILEKYLCRKEYNSVFLLKGIHNFTE